MTQGTLLWPQGVALVVVLSCGKFDSWLLPVVKVEQQWE